MREVFISYKDDDKKLGNNDGTVARELCKQLEDVGITCWIAPRNADDANTSGFAASIMKGISECKVFLLVFSRFTNDSEFVANEINVACEEKKKIVLYKLDSSSPSPELKFYLGRKPWVDASGDYKAKFRELISMVNKKLGKTEERTDPPSNPSGKGQNEGNLIQKSPLSFNVKGVTFNMIFVEGGTFIMGATPGQKDEAFSDEEPPTHRSLESFYIGEMQVTQALWKAVMGDNPSKFKGNLKRPVECVSWLDCQEFIKKLNTITGKRFHLPTEAQWEYAARGGMKNNDLKYAGSSDLDSVAWYENNSGKTTHPVAQKNPNELGLYDMIGNVWEWCHDGYGNDDPEGNRDTSSDFRHMIRGCCWRGNARYCRVSYRNNWITTKSGSHLGLRLAL